MCLSFTDRPMDRQEQLWAGTIALAVDDGFWAIRSDYYRDWMASERYAQMSTDALARHHTDLVEEHGDNWKWAPIIDTVNAVLKERADTGAML